MPAQLKQSKLPNPIVRRVSCDAMLIYKGDGDEKLGRVNRTGAQ
jgi:hypothetical protein